MNIRFATIDDTSAIIELGRAFHAASRYREHEYCVEKIAAQLHAAIVNNNGGYCFMVVEDQQSGIIGGLIGRIEEHIFSTRPIANVLYYYVYPEHRMSGAAVRLMHAFRKWAEHRNAFELSTGVHSGMEIGKTDSFMRKMGFTLTGGNYSLMLATR